MKDSKDSSQTRRNFFVNGIALTVLGLTSAVCVCFGVSGCKKHQASIPVIPAEHVKVIGKRVSVEIGKVEVLRPVGSSAKVVHPKLEGPILVVHTGKHSYHAVSNRCTHRGAELEYKASEQQLVCVNYGHSVFRLNGSVVRGPAPKPIRTFRTLVFGDKLEIFL